MEIYFFRHGFDAQLSGQNAPIPGRYLFTVEGRSLQREGNRLIPRERSEHRICADGFQDEGPGSNMDPCVLAERLPWFLSFCNVGKPVVDGDGRDLGVFPGVVKRGDVVIFGDPAWADALAVDTVMRANDRIPLPSLGGAFAFERQFEAYWSACIDVGLGRPVAWKDFIHSPDFVLNLADSLPAPRRSLEPPDSQRAAALLGHRRQAFHPKPSIAPHQQLVGTRCRVFEPTGIVDVHALFEAGRGFDFVPLGAGARPTSAMVERRPGLLTVPFTGAAAKLRRASIFRLSPDEGQALLRSILDTADRLVVGPLRWKRPRRFTHFEITRRPSKTNPANDVSEYTSQYVPVPDGCSI